MRLARLTFAIALLGSAFSVDAAAFENSLLNDLATGLSFSSPSAGCAPFVESSREESAQPDYQKLLDARDFCGAFRLAERMSRVENGEMKQWKRRSIEALTSARDFRQAVLEGLRAIQVWDDLRTDPGFRLSILKAVEAAIDEQGNDKDPAWMEWALGMRDSGNPLSSYLRFSKWLKEFPNAPEAASVRQRELKIIDFYAAREIEIARLHAVRERYMAAIIRLETLYRYPAIQKSPALRSILSAVIGHERAFAEAIEKNSWFSSWTDRKLRDVFRIPDSDPVKRDELAAMLRKKADQTQELLEKLTRVTVQREQK